MAKQKILFVDDEPTILEVLVEAFGDRFNIQTASNGHEGLLKIESFDPHLVVTDINMPILTGLKLLEKLRANSDQRPVILFSAYGDTKNLTSAVKAQAFDFLEKPVNLLRLETSIVAALEAVKIRSENGDSDLNLASTFELQCLKQISVPLKASMAVSKTLMKEITELLSAEQNEVKKRKIIELKTHCEMLKDNISIIDESQKGYRRRSAQQIFVASPDKVEYEED